MLIPPAVSSSCDDPATLLSSAGRRVVRPAGIELVFKPIWKSRWYRQRREASQIRWNQPINSVFRRVWAWTDMILADHGLIRMVYLNLHRVSPKYWRAAQPTPSQFRDLSRLGIKTVINLRGGRQFGSWPLEREVCESKGMQLVEFVIRSRGAPDPAQMAQADEFFNSLNYPVVAHCKSGADRAGFMATLYLLVHEKQPVSVAMKQLSWRYGHFRFAKTGILDAFFERYRDEGEAKGIDFRTWVTKHYDPVALEREFEGSAIGNWIVDRILRRE